MPVPNTAGAAGKPKRGSRQAAAAPAGAAPIALAAELGIEAAASLRADLAARIDDPRSVVLDGAEVQRIHTAAMQLFCLFCSDRRHAGHETVWHRPSPALRSAAALLGVTTILQIARENA